MILHIRYTARQGVVPQKVVDALNSIFSDPPPQLALLFSLPHDFPTEWATFVNGAGFTATIRKDYFPYFTQGKTVNVVGLDLYGKAVTQHRAASSPSLPLALAPADESFVVTANADSTVLKRNKDAQVSLVVRYSL